MIELLQSVPLPALTALAALAQLGLVKVARKTKLDTQVLVAIVTLVVGVAWVAFSKYVPQESQKAATEFAGEVFIIQWGLYEFWKKFRQTSAH